MRKLTIWISVLVASSLACGIEQPSPTEQFGFSITPNLTLTAVFSGVDSSLTATSAAATSIASQPTLAPSSTPSEGGLQPTPAFTLGAGSYEDPPSIGTTTPHPDGGPLVHAGPVVVAMYVSPAPEIDGDFSDWEGVPYPISDVVFGPEYYLGSHDISGNFQVGWDATHLYVGVEVTDNTIVQNSTGEWLYLGDSLEIVIDADVSGDYSDTSLNIDDHQLGFSPGMAQTGGLPEAYLWFPLYKRGDATTVDVAFVMTDQGYKMEAAIPWSLFGVTAAVDQNFGFAISISDNDAVGQNWQQSMISNVGTRYLLDPTTWGNIVLTGP